MAVAAPKRRTAPAPPPSRTTAPKRKAPQRKAAARAGAVAAPAPSRAPARKPARKPVRKAPARTPQRARPKVRRSPGARVVPLAGRTAVAVAQLPDSGLIVRMTRGRLWIGVLGVLLVGIVALNVVNLSFSATAAEVQSEIAALQEENRVLESREATRFSTARLQHAGREAGLVAASPGDTTFVEFNRDTFARAAQRLAAASP